MGNFQEFHNLQSSARFVFSDKRFLPADPFGQLSLG